MEPIIVYRSYPHIYFADLLEAIKEKVPFIEKEKIKSFILSFLIATDNEPEYLIEARIVETSTYSVGSCTESVQNDKFDYYKQDIKDCYMVFDEILIGSGFKKAETIFIDF